MSSFLMPSFYILFSFKNQKWIKSLRVTSLYNSENSFAQYKSALKMSDFLMLYSLTAPLVRPSTRYFCKKRTKSTGTIKAKIAVAEIAP